MRFAAIPLPAIRRQRSVTSHLSLVVSQRLSWIEGNRGSHNGHVLNLQHCSAVWCRKFSSVISQGSTAQVDIARRFSIAGMGLAQLGAAGGAVAYPAVSTAIMRSAFAEPTARQVRETFES